MIIEVAMRTDKGMVREQNEDAIGGDPDLGVLILADGMGGANAGEVASELAVDLLSSHLIVGRSSDTMPDQSSMQMSIETVNQAILELAEQVPEYQGMGTTLVLGVFDNNSIRYAHVGDSRLYRLRQGRLEQLTIDHTLIQEMINLGDFANMEEAMMAGVPTNVLSRALGSQTEIVSDIAESEVEQGDLYLFCSDGLTGMVTDDEMQSILENNNLDLEQQVNELVDFACRCGGVDNISVIVVRPQLSTEQ
ncbi:MAG: protein phosphatase 2C domain-containing protein [Candidatus Thiodiazotropha taylori]|uniref:Protein phosphatase 2C domain-containing protein n=1 Tax=Candidatus Thiodiazotropha taylori TaxID=2792791 RepID=A0A9E4P4A1_9GAMM|nr:protein phosphatase 2C domain-containing protein [Candidatus Thiodiazotropha taylori]MCG7963755.1 protein phosphatase 2C domain-containing protein [Candidatus Thiodiazotropha endolucinida]MCG7894681.1 protein phosphatase 2C domain-containing protein [Candidatus Thiodiazotropha taylori]MCG7911237.1 protein phosphatase 2C domain-containing protein [Candidatus Thiodiazotropha taylori]MCG7917052.1 protein phosphatase 2C domain-containing protein [Candidatus Thiodiazotropha taylori]